MAPLPRWVSLTVIFLLTVAVMACIGHGVARVFVQFEALEAYRLDILGSIGGIVVFSVLAFLQLPPIAWGVIVAVLLVVLLGGGRSSSPSSSSSVVLGIQSVRAQRLLVAVLQDHGQARRHRRIVGGIEAHDTLTISANNIPHQTAYDVDDAAPPPAVLRLPVPPPRPASARPGAHRRRRQRQRRRRRPGPGGQARRRRRDRPRHPVAGLEVPPQPPVPGPAGDRAHRRRPGLHRARRRASTTSSCSPCPTRSPCSPARAACGWRTTSSPRSRWRRCSASSSRAAPSRCTTTTSRSCSTGTPPRCRTSTARRRASRSATRWPTATRPSWSPAPAPRATAARRGPARGWTRPPTTTRSRTCRSRTIPSFYRQTLLLMLGASLLLIRLAGGRFRSMVRYTDLAFMGAAFLLLETKNVVQFALLFGTTWFVNSLVFAGVLLSVYLAVEVARHVRLPEPRRLYPLLLAPAGRGVARAAGGVAVARRRCPGSSSPCRSRSRRSSWPTSCSPSGSGRRRRPRRRSPPTCSAPSSAA